MPFETGDTNAEWPDGFVGIDAKTNDVFSARAGERLHIKNVTTEILVIEVYENGA